MILKWTDSIVQWLVNENIISEQETDVYQYCVQTFLFQLLLYCTIFLLAIYLDVLGLTIAYYLGFLPIRYVAGGYHASTHVRCFFMTLSLYIVSLTVCVYIEQIFVYKLFLLCVTIAYLLILWAAPVDHKNHPFSPREKDSFRRKSYIITTIVVTISVLVLIISTNLAVAMGLGTFSAACSLFFGKIQRGKELSC